MSAGSAGNSRSNVDLMAPSKVEPSSSISRIFHSVRKSDLRCRYKTFGKRTLADKGRDHNSIDVCHDWIFSSGSNIHIAIDRSAFKNYTAFASYVLTVSSNRQVSVIGIGSVELIIRRQKGSRQCHTITLNNVLHIPSWMCNVFSDIYFKNWNKALEHTWGTDGVQFMQRDEEGRLKSWGFTQEFCGLDRLVLARDLRGRSPMLDDQDKEVYSVNVIWSQGQKDRWEEILKDSSGTAHGESLVDLDVNCNQESRTSIFVLV